MLCFTHYCYVIGRSWFIKISGNNQNTSENVYDKMLVDARPA